MAATDGSARPTASYRLTTTGRVVLGLFLVPMATLTVGDGTGPLAGSASILVLLTAAAVLVIGVVWPAVAIRRVTVAARTVADALVDEVVDLTVVASGDVDVEVRALDPAGPWRRAVPGIDVVLPHTAAQRGVFDHVRIEARTTAPLGVFAAHRTHLVALSGPIWVAPRPLPVDWRRGAAPVESGPVAGGALAIGGDTVRSVRPYAAGDPARHVHWRTTARRGELVVRELEPPRPVGQALVLDLTGLGDRADVAAAYALGACFAVLDGGGLLVLCTRDPDGPSTAEVTTRFAVRRRIAAAVEGEPGAPPVGWPLAEIGR